jgi:hypothetical protein
MPSVPQVHIIGSGSNVVQPDPAASSPLRTVRSPFYQSIFQAAAKGRMHGCLVFSEGLSFGSVLWWKVMEDQADNSWETIRWQLPKGEVRDIPRRALIHSPAI